MADDEKMSAAQQVTQSDPHSSPSADPPVEDKKETAGPMDADLKEHEERAAPFVQACSASDGSRNEAEEEEEKKGGKPQSATAASANGPRALSSPWWVEDEEYRQLAGGAHVDEGKAASPPPAASSSASASSASASASGPAMVSAASANGGHEAGVLLKLEDDGADIAARLESIDADPEVREVVYEMRDDVVDHIESGCNWKIYSAKWTLRTARKEAEYQARLEAAPKRDRPDRRPAAAAVSRRLMQQAQEEEEVNRHFNVIASRKAGLQLASLTGDPDTLFLLFSLCSSVRQSSVHILR
jgi:hypothetical protein